MFCREQAARMSAHREEIESAGGRLVAIGNGSAVMARDFVEQFSVDFPVYTDPSRKTFALAGFKRSVLFFGPRTFKRGRAAKAAGFRQGPVAGDPWQQGGEVIVAPEGELLYCRSSSGPGDHAPVPELLEVLHSYADTHAAAG